MLKNSIIPVCEVWFQTNGDINDAFNMVRVRARVHVDVVPREAIVVALKEVLQRLEGGSSKLLVKEDSDLLVFS